MASMRSAPGFVQYIGKRFVKVYYDLLHTSPEILSGLYHDTCSTLSRPEEDGTSSVTTTVKAINAKLQAFNHGNSGAEIKSVDVLESLNNGITILVTGCITRKDNIVKSFSQSFFLAPQGEEAFCVLNDIFRYIENVNHHTEDRLVATATSREQNAESEAEFVYVDDRHDSWVVV